MLSSTLLAGAAAALLPVLARAEENPFTTLLSQTDKFGRVTGIPAMPSLPTLPPAASIGAGFSEGITTVWVAPHTYAVISVHDGTTDVIDSITTGTLPGISSPDLPSATQTVMSPGATMTTGTMTVTGKAGSGGGMTSAPESTKGSGGSGSGSGASTSSSSQAGVMGAVAAPGAAMAVAGLALAWL